jgi:hypothetical protein
MKSNKKSLLLGSAAVLIAVSGARAADVVIIEPEPVEYVRVCDAYGAGWWFIPGTETCIKVSGYVRTTYSHTERSLNDGHFVGAYSNITAVDPDTGTVTIETDSAFAGEASAAAVAAASDNNHLFDLTAATISGAEGGPFNQSAWDYRGRLNIEARDETEYGTLASQLRLQGGDSDSSGDAAVGVDRALISLGGGEGAFRIGYTDTYWTTNHGYGGGPATGAVFSDSYYNFDQALIFDYTFSVDVFGLTVGVQDTDATTDQLDVYGGVNVATDFGTYAFTAIRESETEAVAYKGSVDIPIGDWTAHGHYMWDEDGMSRYVSADGLSDTIQHQWGVQLSGKVADTLTVYGLYSVATSDIDGGANDDIDGAELTVWTAGIQWTPVIGLAVNFEYGHETRTADLGYSFDADATELTYSVYDDEADVFLVRVTRSW